MSAASPRCPGVNRVLKLSSNEGAFGVPPGAQEAYPARGRGAAPLSRRRRHRAAPGDRRAVQAGSGADRLRRRVGRPDLPALPRLWRARPRHRHERARLRHLPDRRHLRRQPGDQDAGARPDRRCRCHAGGGVAGDAAGVPRQPEQPDRQHAAVCRGGAAARRPAARGAAGARRRLCRIRRAAGLRPGHRGWSMPATTP